MARVRLVSDADAKGNPLVETLFDGARKLLGRVPNSIRARAHLPEVAAFTLAVTASLGISLRTGAVCFRSLGQIEQAQEWERIASETGPS